MSASLQRFVPVRFPLYIPSTAVQRLSIASVPIAIFITILPHFYSITIQSTVCAVRQTVIKVTGGLFSFTFVPYIIPPSILRYFPGVGKRSPYNQYSTQEEENNYWNRAERDAKQLEASNAKAEDGLETSKGDKPILYYTPRLLPRYREVEQDGGADEYMIPAESFVGWHKHLFPNKIHPTVTQASTLMKYFSRRDLKEVYRISRSKPGSGCSSDSDTWSSFDGHYAEWRTGRKNKYRKRWSRYLEEKSPDVVIVFEDA